MPSPKKKVKKENEDEVKVANDTNDSTDNENPTDIEPGITERYKDA